MLAAGRCLRQRMVRRQTRQFAACVGFAGKCSTTGCATASSSSNCELFHQRPFVWHVRDGRPRRASMRWSTTTAWPRRNGEGRRMLEKLLYRTRATGHRQRADQTAGGRRGGRTARVAAELPQDRVDEHPAGEPPRNDLFVHSRSPSSRSAGSRDINDGVRINIRRSHRGRLPGAPWRLASCERRPRLPWGRGTKASRSVRARILVMVLGLGSRKQG